jgi:hypothetical protein
MGHIGAHRHHPDLVFEMDVTQVAAGPGDETRVFETLD